MGTDQGTTIRVPETSESAEPTQRQPICRWPKADSAGQRDCPVVRCPDQGTRVFSGAPAIFGPTPIIIVMTIRYIECGTPATVRSRLTPRSAVRRPRPWRHELVTLGTPPLILTPPIARRSRPPINDQAILQSASTERPGSDGSNSVETPSKGVHCVDFPTQVKGAFGARSVRPGAVSAPPAPSTGLHTLHRVPPSARRPTTPADRRTGSRP